MVTATFVTAKLSVTLYQHHSRRCHINFCTFMTENHTGR